MVRSTDSTSRSDATASAASLSAASSGARERPRSVASVTFRTLPAADRGGVGPTTWVHRRRGRSSARFPDKLVPSVALMTQPVALVTGASRGLGLALAAGLAARGWALVIDARDRATLEHARQLLPAPVVALPGDVTDAAHREQLLRAADELGDLRLLVNNASTLGVSPLPTLATYPLDQLSEVFAVNVVAPLALVQAALPGCAPQVARSST